MSETIPDYAPNFKTPEIADRAVSRVRALLLTRAQAGLKKYGVTTDRTDLGLIDWLRHSLEEKLDDAVYMQRAILELEQEMDDGK